MKLPRLIHRNLKRRPLASVLTTLSVALGVGLFASISALRQAAEDGFQRSAAVCDLVVGAKGSPIDLVLNALYHLRQSPGNIPFGVYEEISAEPVVLWSVPLTVGDTYRGFRVVGVTDEMFESVELANYGKLRFAEGAGFHHSRDELVEFHNDLAAHTQGEHGAHDHDHGNDEWFVAVVGSQAAIATGLSLGSTFVPAHDLQGGVTAKEHEDAPTRVVGVLEPTGTPIDRAIYIPVGAFYSIEGHQPVDSSLAGGTRDPLGLSAILVRTNPRARAQGLQFLNKLQNRLDLQAVRPVDEVRALFLVVGDIDKILRLVAAMVVIVALVGVLVALYNTMGARRREFAILRALGASRRTVLTLVVGESAAIALGGGLLGLGLAYAGVALARGALQEQFGVALTPGLGADDLLLVVAVTLVGAVAGLVPALAAYRTETARYLAPQA